MDDRITAILAHLRGGVAGIYAQKKLDKLLEKSISVIASPALLTGIQDNEPLNAGTTFKAAEE